MSGGYFDIDNSASQEIWRLKKGPKIVRQEVLGATIQGSSGQLFVTTEYLFQVTVHTK